MSDPLIQPAFPHRVRFTHDAFSPTNPILRDALTATPTPPLKPRADKRSPEAPDHSPPPTHSQTKTLIVVDQALALAHPNLQEKIEAYFDAHRDTLASPVAFLALPGGEQAKNDLSLLESLLGQLHHHRMDRHAIVLAIGGGALLDMVGFAAAVTHRGVRLVRMPTTTLAQCDSGVGVKNGVNMFGKKNFIGTFAVPFAVVNDLSLLTTLAPRDWRCGLSEAVKVALLKDPAFFDTIVKHRDRLRDCDPAVGDPVWQRSAELHLAHIAQGGDPFEATTHRPLDFGHWAAHKLEQLTDYDLPHGEAVAIGLALDVTYSCLVGLLAPATAAHIRNTLADLGLPTTHPRLADPALLDGLAEFREHLGGQLTLTLLHDVGHPQDIHQADTALYQQAIAQLLTPAPISPL